jgi:hypothetical protein
MVVGFMLISSIVPILRSTWIALSGLHFDKLQKRIQIQKLEKPPAEPEAE